MKSRPTSVIVAAVAAMISASSAQAAGLKQVGEIAMPGDMITDIGIMAIDQATGLGYLADKTNKSVDRLRHQDRQICLAHPRLHGPDQGWRRGGSQWRRGRQGRSVGERRRQHDQGDRHQDRKSHGDHSPPAARSAATEWPMPRILASSLLPIRMTIRRISA